MIGIKTRGDTLKPKSQSNKVVCPQCGRKAEIRLCFACSNPVGARLFSKKYCPACKGKGVVIHCEWCARSKAEQHPAVREADLKALKKNPFLPYYDKRFSKYRK